MRIVMSLWRLSKMRYPLLVLPSVLLTPLLVFGRGNPALLGLGVVIIIGYGIGAWLARDI